MEEYKYLKFKERKNTDCMKWDGMEKQFGRDDLFPAWVADMDIESPECVRKALSEYVDFNVHGYYCQPKEFLDSFISWMKKYHNYEPDREWIRFAPGVVPAIYWSIQMLTDVDDSVAIMPPVYYPFENAIRDTSRTLVTVPLIRKAGRYYMDLAAFEEKVVRKKVKVFILCSPHNPVGRVWTEEELRGVMDICRKYNVFVISDEIHHDLIPGDVPQTTAASLTDYESILITLTSASKTFNLAGCQNAFVIIQNPALRAKYDAFTRRIGSRSGSNFGYVAYRAAYEEGRLWLEELNQLIRSNFEILRKGLRFALPQAYVTPLEGTYLAWVDLSPYMANRDTERIVRDHCLLAVDFGEWFGGEEYKNFIRINLATSPDNVREIVRRLETINEVVQINMNVEGLAQAEM